MRPIRLRQFDPRPEDDSTEQAEGTTDVVESEEGKIAPSGISPQNGGPDPVNVGSPLARDPATQSPLIDGTSSGRLRALTGKLAVETTIPLGEEGAHHLLKRTPSNYLINQIYGLWLYGSLFILTILLTHAVSVNDYAVYTALATAFNTIAYVVAFGLEDAITTFVPRLASEHGEASAASLVRRLLGIRLLILVLTFGLLLFGLPYLADLFSFIPTPLTKGIATSLRDPNLQMHSVPIAVWVLGNGLFSLLNAVYAAIMRMKVVFIVGGLGQVFLLGLGFFALHLGWGIESILWLQGLVTVVGAIVFALCLAPLLFARGSTYRQPLGPVFRLGFASWFTNLVSGALLKQIALLLLIAYASQAALAYFNVSFQLTDGANLLLVSGFGGVGVAALAAAFVGKNHGRLSRIWQTLIKVETLLSAPGLIFSLFNAQIIVVMLYGQQYAPAGQLFAIFLALNLLVRVQGQTIHQSTLYVLGKARFVVIAQWVGLFVVLGLGFWLVPIYGAAGALVADGFSRLVTYGLMLAFLWRDLPEKYPFGYTLRIVLATALAALLLHFGLAELPVLALHFHPLAHLTGKLLLAVSGVLFVVLSAALLVVVRPLSRKDLDMIAEIRPGVARYLKWFAQRAS